VGFCGGVGVWGVVLECVVGCWGVGGGGVCFGFLVVGGVGGGCEGWWWGFWSEKLAEICYNNPKTGGGAGHRREGGGDCGVVGGPVSIKGVVGGGGGLPTGTKILHRRANN